MATLWGAILLQFQSTAYAEYGIQVGAFANENNATLLAERVAKQGFTAIIIPIESPGKLTRVIVGPYTSTATAASARKQLAEHNWPGMLVDYPLDTTRTDQEPARDSAGDAGVLAVDAPGLDTPSDPQVLIIEDSENSTQLVIGSNNQEESDTITIGERPQETDEEYLPYSETTSYSGDDALETPNAWPDKLRYRNNDFSIGLDKAHFEYGNLYKSDSTADTSNYGHLALSAEWKQSPQWETQLSGRLDWYHQTGDPDINEKTLDYGETFVRFRGDSYRITAGTQKIIWGRIDEVPPTDRMSRVDLARGILDPLPERRRALPAIRFEGFRQSYKLDAVLLPDFRKAYLPEKDSVWYPINRTQGTILGFATTPPLQALIENGSISEDEPGGTAGYGLRASNTGERFDYALTVQRIRQSLPYWQLDSEVRGALLSGADPVTAINSSSTATFQARYPRAWVLGGDMGFEALDGTWRFEAAWISDTPVTRSDLRYDTVDSASWAAGVQFYPGDSEYRVNLQIAGINMIDAPSILDRKNTYNFNGSIHGEFGNNRWRTDTRFFIGLDEKDIYVNPEITFIGWEPHEIYAAWHYFDGDDETIGGYWQDSSLLTLGLRTQF